MRLIDSGLNLQFTAQKDPGGGWTIIVANEDDTDLVLDRITVLREELTGEQYSDECADWVNAHPGTQIDELRKTATDARNAKRWYKGGHAGTTPFGAEAERQLDIIAHFIGRADVYLGTDDSAGGTKWFVFGPWMRRLTGERHYRKPNLTAAVEFIDLAFKHMCAEPTTSARFRQLQPDQVPEGADWVAVESARARGIKSDQRVRVVDVLSIANGGHVVTWTDNQAFYVTEDYNTVQSF